jgi:hypothetical protein
LSDKTGTRKICRQTDLFLNHELGGHRN